MTHEMSQKPSWLDTWKSWTRPKVLVMLVLGFSAGLPILLIFSTLSVWLREAGVERSAVTFFSWAALGYSFKFIWAPIVDLLPLPFLTNLLGKRRSWLLVAQCCIIAAILWMSSVDPVAGKTSLTVMAWAAVMLGFSSATQDIVIDAYRIECDKQDMQALLASVYIAGYRIGMLVAGAGSLFLASWLGTDAESYNYSAWKITYMAMAATMLIGIVATLLCDEPKAERVILGQKYSALQYTRFVLLFLCTAFTFAVTFFYTATIAETSKQFLTPLLTAPFAAFFIEGLRLLAALLIALTLARSFVLLGVVDHKLVDNTYIVPVREFFDRFGGRTALLLLALVGCYRISDIVLGVISNVFYLDMGFSKNVIAGITKSFGLGMTLIGGFLGGMLTLRFGVYRILLLGAVLAALTNVFFVLLVGARENVAMLTLVIAADNLSAGLAATAFVAFLSSLTNISFTAVQYAIFSSMMTLLPKFVGGYSGSIVSGVGYEKFFIMTALLGVPVIALVWYCGRLLKVEN